MNSVIMITQFFFTLVIGMYFFTKLRNEKSDSETLANNSKKEAEHLNCMRHIHLSEPVTETAPDYLYYKYTNPNTGEVSFFPGHNVMHFKNWLTSEDGLPGKWSDL